MVTVEIEASFLWLRDKTVQVILRAIKNIFVRFPKKKQRICNTEENEWETRKCPPHPPLFQGPGSVCDLAGGSNHHRGRGVAGTLNHDWGDEFFHSCQAHLTPSS